MQQPVRLTVGIECWVYIKRNRWKIFVTDYVVAK